MKFAKSQLWLIAIVIMGIILRLPFLTGSFWLDEAAQALESIRPLSQQLSIAEDFQPPLLHIVLHLVQYILHAEWWLRLFGAVIPGIGSIICTYYLAKHFFTQKIALVSTALLAINPFHIFYSQELRPYALPLFIATLSWLLLVRFKKKYFLYGLVSLLGLFSSYLYPFVLVGQIAYILYYYRAQFKKFIYTGLAVFVGFSWWLPFFWEQLQTSQRLRLTLPQWENVVSIPALKAPFLVLGKYIFGLVDISISVPFALITFVVLLPLIYWFGLEIKKIVTKKTGVPKSLVFRATTVLIPLATASLFSFVLPVLRPKRVLYLWPFITIWFSAATLYLFEQQRKFTFLWLVPITIFGLTSLFGYSQYLTQETLQRENWRQLHSRIHQDFNTDSTLIIFSFRGPFAPWRWYERQDQQTNFTTLSTGEYAVSNVDLSETLKPVVEYKYVLVFDYLRDLTDPENAIEAELNQFGYQEVGAIDTPNIGFVRIFVQPESIIGLST